MFSVFAHCAVSALTVCVIQMREEKQNLFFVYNNQIDRERHD